MVIVPLLSVSNISNAAMYSSILSFGIPSFSRTAIGFDIAVTVSRFVGNQPVLAYRQHQEEGQETNAIKSVACLLAYSLYAFDCQRTPPPKRLVLLLPVVGGKPAKLPNKKIDSLPLAFKLVSKYLHSFFS